MIGWHSECYMMSGESRCLRIYHDDAYSVRMPSDDGAQRVPLGPVGGYVIRNISLLRGRLTYKELSERLDQLGRRIPELGLSRIERGNRRVDADDLIALAIALDVSPAELLLPSDAGPDDEIELTARLRVPARIARGWLDGHIPLPQADVITWPRRSVVHIRESEIGEMRRRLDELEQLVQLGHVARQHHDERMATEARSHDDHGTGPERPGAAS